MPTDKLTLAEVKEMVRERIAEWRTRARIGKDLIDREMWARGDEAQAILELLERVELALL